MNRITSAAAAALLALTGGALAACSPSASSDGLKPVVRLATGVDPSFTPVYVAAAKGFFDDHDVNVEYITTEGGPTMTQAVIAGEAEIATQSDGTTVTLMASNPGLRAIAAFEQSSTYIKVAFGEGISDPSQITKMGAIPGIATLATVRYLESVGVDPDSVELVEATPPDIPTLLERGDIDASVVYEPWATRAAEQSGGEIVGDIGDFDLSYSQWLVADEKWLSEHEEEAAGVVAAIGDANEFIKENPEEAAEITEDAIKTPQDQTLDIMQDLEFGARDFTDAELAQAKESAQFFVDQGVIEAVPDLDGQVLTGWYAEHVTD